MPEVRVVYEDENLLLADKPQGLVVHTDDEGTVDTLINRVQRYLYEKGEYDPVKENSFSPSLCNRIDRNTGGIVIVAKNAAALRELNRCVKERQLDKYYLCLVKGYLTPESGRLCHYHIKDEKENKALVFDAPREGARTMLTDYLTLEKKGGYSLLRVELLTGRTHQIRAQFAHIGHPLVGDGKYGENKLERQKGFVHQALYSYQLRFRLPADSSLAYLNGRLFSVDSVWFAEKGIPASLLA